MAEMRLQNPGAFDLSLHNSSPLFAASSDDIQTTKPMPLQK